MIDMALNTPLGFFFIFNFIIIIFSFHFIPLPYFCYPSFKILRIERLKTEEMFRKRSPK